MDIFQFAMEKEKYSEDFYRQLADQSQNKGIKNIFLMLADEEQKHYKTVQQMKQKNPQQVTNADVITDGKKVFANMKKGLQEFDFSKLDQNKSQMLRAQIKNLGLDNSQVELYRKAQQIEQESKNYYLEKASQLSDKNQKDILNTLANEEQKHYWLIDNIIELVTRPEQWLENPEWYHLEEY